VSGNANCRGSEPTATLAINAGSSSVKCALFTFDPAPRPLVRETIEGVGSSCLPQLLEWVDAQTRGALPIAIGHRIVHGGSLYRDAQAITGALVDNLREMIPFAPNHLPDAIALIEALRQHCPDASQFACFDTAFHGDLPDVARRLPIPAAYEARGVRRYGFHGLSYAYLIQELERLAGPQAAAGRLILAHLGNGSSLAAVDARRSLDTTMAFTPIGGVVMSTRSGDLDPGVVTYLARNEGLTPDQVEDLLSQRSGLLGISDTTGDMRALLDREAIDPGCRLAVAAYAYSIKKAIGAFAAVLGGLDTLVFSGGIGEHAPAIRARICDGLAFLGVELDASRNAMNAPVISPQGVSPQGVSPPAARVEVRVIPTDEELMIARAAYGLLAPR
jgi:acetate kinase